MEIVCPNCKRLNAEGRRYCAHCGINLGDAVPKDARHNPIYVIPAQSSLCQRISRWLRGLRTNASQE